MGALSILMQQKYFFLWLWVRAPKSMATQVRTLPMKRRKRLACDVLDTFATLANHVHDVSDIDWQTQIAALTAEFLRLSNVIFFFFYKPDHKLTTAVVSLSSMPILSKGPVMWLCFMPHFSLHHNQLNLNLQKIMTRVFFYQQLKERAMRSYDVKKLWCWLLVMVVAFFSLTREDI